MHTQPTISSGPGQAAALFLGLRLLERQVYRTPNIFGDKPMIRFQLDLGTLEDYPTSALPGFTGRLTELLPRLTAGMRPEQIRVILNETEAIGAALQAGRPGDLLVVMPNEVEKAWAQVTSYDSSALHHEAYGVDTGAQVDKEQPALKNDEVSPEHRGQHA